MSFFIPPPKILPDISLPTAYLIGKWLFIGLDILLIAAFIRALRGYLPYRPKLRLDLEPVRKILTLRDVVVKEQWESVLRKFSTGSPDSVKLAVIEADKIVDDVLKNLGLEGEHMADRLERLSPEEVKSLDRLWRAHRLRNNLVHEPTYQLSLPEAEAALDGYQAFLQEVQALRE